MFRKSGPYLAVAALALLTAVACTKSDSGNSAPENSVIQPAPRPADSTEYAPGVASHTSDVVLFTVFSPGGAAASDEELALIFAAFPELKVQITQLASINRGIVTTDSHIELYDATGMAMVLLLNENAATVVSARSPFTPESIAYASVSADQKEMTSTVTFNLKACTTPEKQDGGQDKGQSQDKGQDKGQVKEPICQTLSAAIDMKEQPQKQDKGQDQDQDQGQDKDQGKGKN